MGNPSPRYTAEFKQKAVELYGKSGTTYAEVARGPGCNAGSPADWVKKADAAGPAPDANPLQIAEDLRRLKRESERPLHRQAAGEVSAKRAEFESIFFNKASLAYFRVAVTCGNGLSAQCVRPRPEINPSDP